MAALCTGISYGLSQQSNGLDDKELIYVKLTDSALRAIEEFQRNQNKLGSSINPSIKFLGNGQGYLSFPSLNSNGSQTFTFSLSEEDGSLECIQQSSGQLQNLGLLSNKMRIHANEDVYETTRARMATIEENVKNKCTREIKPNSGDIGRKVKLKASNSRLNHIPSSNLSNNSKRDPYNSSAYSSVTNNNINNNLSVPTNSLPSNNNSSINSNLSTSPISKSNGMLQQQQSLQQKAISSLTASGNDNGIVPNNRVANSRSQSRGNPDIMRRSIKERLIHLLALRPYKKPELYARINSDGVRDREKNCITAVLKQISFMKDNTYHLNRHIWNDVHEDWPFFSEQDRQILKRRKPQNLTPPLSSDGGSSTSGQSPTSMDNGSPPPAVKRPSTMNNHKEFLDGVGPTSKKPRISHYKKDSYHDNNISRRGLSDTRESTVMNRRSRDVHDMRSSSNYYGSNVTNAQESEDSGVSLSYSVLPADVAKRISSTQQLNERDQDKNLDLELKMYRESPKKVANGNDFSDFTRITSVEQRRKYKTEFDNDFAEYRELHTIVDRVSRRFSSLEEELKHTDPNGRRYKEIQKQILQEYEESIKDTRFQETKKRFDYLHKKLSHIKHLVNDYDMTLRNGNRATQESY